MRHGLWMIPLGGALILAGCGQSDSGKKSLPEKVAETTRKAAKETGKDLEQARREFQKEFKEQMETLNGQIKTW